MFLATLNKGDSTFYWRMAGIAGLTILALMAVARLLAWYVVRFGRRQVDNQAADHGMSQRRLGWEIAWKPVLMLMVMIYAIVGIPLGWMWFQEKRTIAALPVVTVDDTQFAGEYRRVQGNLASTGDAAAVLPLT
jgi:TRAP-type C4-dicarboxylate transport system permease large subunit